MAGYDFNAELAETHAEREKAFGAKPFVFGYIESEPDENGETKQIPAQFFVGANVGYLGIKNVALLSESSTGGETFTAIEESVFSMIDPKNGALERFREVVSNPYFPITFDDLVKLQGWLLTEHTALPPTEQPPSAPSSSANGESSTDPSSTAQGEASTS
jgi:hypothetical protein